MRRTPTLETGRLLLRGWTKSDRDKYFAVLQEPAVFRHFGPQPMGMEECWRRLMAGVGSWQLSGFGAWAVERKSDGKLIGMTTLFNAWRELLPQFGDEPEMGWIFATETHGQGMAGEACSAAIAWAEANLQSTAIWAIVAPANAPSLKLAAKLGFERHSETIYHGEPTLVLKRPAWAS